MSKGNQIHEYALHVREELITAICRVLGAVTGRLASRQDTVPPPNPSIVILRRCCLGDVLSSTPMVDAIRRRYPLARIDYATSAYARPAIEGNPDLSGTIEPRVASLRRGRYDVAITLERSPAAGMLPWLAGIPIRVGPNNLSRGFAHNLRVACPPDRSEAGIALDCAAALGVSTDGARARFCPTDHDEAAAAKLLDDAGLASAQLVAMAPGGGVNPGMSLTGKRWPPNRFAALAERLFEDFGWRTILLGGPGDRPSGQAVAGAAPSSHDFTGGTSFGQMGALIRRCRLFVGNDSSPLHLAAAVGTPFAGIFGPSDPVRHRPFGRGEAVAARIPRSAYRNGFADVDCIEMVTLEEVLGACLRLAGAPGS